MKLPEIVELIENVPTMTERQGTIIYNMIREQTITKILELGTGKRDEQLLHGRCAG